MQTTTKYKFNLSKVQKGNWTKLLNALKKTENQPRQITDFLFEEGNTNRNTCKCCAVGLAFTKVSKLYTSHGWLGVKFGTFWGTEFDNKFGVTHRECEITSLNDRGLAFHIIADKLETFLKENTNYFEKKKVKA